MKKAEIRVGGLYSARISGRYVTVRVDAIRDALTGYPPRRCVEYTCVNLSTSRRLMFHSAAKFRGEVCPAPAPGSSRNVPTDSQMRQMIDEMRQEGERPSMPNVSINDSGRMASDTPVVDHVLVTVSAEDYDEDTGEWVKREGEQCLDPTGGPVPKVTTETVQTDSVDVLAMLDIPVDRIAPHDDGPVLTEEQQYLLDLAQQIESQDGGRPRVVVMKAGAGCLIGDTILHINRAGKSREMCIQHVVEQFNGLRPKMTRSVDDGVTFHQQRMKPWDLSISTYIARADGNVIKLGQIKTAWCSGEKEVYELCTTGGRIIQATSEHPFMTSEGGWAELGDLAIGDSIQVNSGRSVKGRGEKINYRYTDTRFHPQQTCRSKPRQRYGVPTHRLVVEAVMNSMPFATFVWTLRNDRAVCETLTYLKPGRIVHHEDGNTSNNHIDNLKMVDGIKGHSDEHEWVNNVLWRVGHDTVASITKKGTEVTYDIEVSDDPHNFIANGFVVHNTGKTFELTQLEKVLRGRGKYTAFNKSLVVESATKFKTATCSTTHALAYGTVGAKYKHRLNTPRVRSYAIASHLGIEDFWIELAPSISPSSDDGKPAVRQLKAAFLAGQVTEAVRRFTQSADPEVTARHFAALQGIDPKGEYKNSDRVKEYLLPFAQKMWEDIESVDGVLPFSHDCYVKLWQLGMDKDRPYISENYILLDEGQDTSPVMLDILEQQLDHAMLVLVGDDCQQIYEWRGAVNAMAHFPDAPSGYLSQSWRFGQTVADVANSVLSRLQEPTQLVMKGNPKIPTRVCAVAKPRCYIYRTNAGAIGRLMWAMKEGKRGHLIGGTKEVVAFCRAAIDLQNGRSTSHNELGCFTNWTEVQEYVKEDEGADLKLMVKLIDTFTAESIVKALENMPAEKDADLVISTAHRSKGREWPSVQLGQDFPLANRLDDATLRVIYVAATRAQEELDLTVCPTFCGGNDLTGVSGETEVGRSEWIPGIDIEYTVPMPTQEDLDIYRAAKAAPTRSVQPLLPPVEPTPTPATESPANAGVGAAAGNPEYTWGSVNGEWCAKGPANAKIGQEVTIIKRNGQRSKVKLVGVARQYNEYWMYKIG